MHKKIQKWRNTSYVFLFILYSAHWISVAGMQTKFCWSCWHNVRRSVGVAYSLPSYVRDLKASQWQDYGNSARTCGNVKSNEYTLIDTDTCSFLGGGGGDNHLKVQWSEVKWSEVKCSDVRWNGAVENLIGVEPSERVVKCIWVKFKWEEVKCRQVEWSVVGWSVVKGSESLSNRVSGVMRRYVERLKFAVCMDFLFIIFFHVLLVPFFIIAYMVVWFCMLLFNFENDVFLCLCIRIVMCVLFCIFCFHPANWHFSATLTEVFPCFFLSCKANATDNSHRRGTASTLPS